MSEAIAVELFLMVITRLLAGPAEMQQEPLVLSELASRLPHRVAVATALDSDTPAIGSK
jgi:hypothetical protein